MKGRRQRGGENGGEEIDITERKKGEKSQPFVNKKRER